MQKGKFEIGLVLGGMIVSSYIAFPINHANRS